MRRRMSPRVKIKEANASIRKKGLLFSAGRREAVEVVDIGTGGLCFITDESVSHDSKYDVVVTLPDGHRIRATAVVRRVEEVAQGYKVGVEFTKLPSQDHDLLNGGTLLGVSEVRVLNTDMDMGEKFRTIRAALGLTIKELSEITGVPHETIMGIEAGSESAPSEAVLRSLAKGLSIERNELGR
jgi:DNA-binding XRE family transcriptional regulator